MNKTIVLTALATAALAAQAQEQGRVLSATPVTQQVAVPRQVCGNETIYSGARPTTGAGAVLGAIAGGAAGNAIGGGSGRAAATALGVIGGAVLGNQVESGRPGYQNVQRCTTETYYDNRVVGYDVVYEYAGRRYTTRTQSDPGQWIPLSVQPAVPGVPGYPSDYPPDYPSSHPSGYGGYAQPGVVVATPPGPPAYVVEPPPTVIEYRAPYGYPHRPPHYYNRY
ncbi:glycine zipper 2TM domain-containing protein [Alicycliphilus denitrificans]|uniref:Glycine zipper 2TM domain-containing protein n=1 Tax=Alicycliphilus denitrificans TaxID=179636 RepID=A0A3R7FD68_9BURK|nr:glycine zipper 2TM domain-containing protein [Alicycliphilus denitrificans]RKJ94717.1 glycine zipper 2TM domain-containing protein [Alicycliphilus denitrificans]